MNTALRCPPDAQPFGCPSAWTSSPEGFAIGVAMKQCRKCGRILPVSEFYVDSTMADGLRGFCKKCWCDYNRAYRQAHKEEERADGRKYRQSHKEETRASHRAYNQAHPEVGRASTHQRRARKLAVGYEHIDDRLVFEQAGYRCQLCGRKTRLDFNRDHPLYPNLDHIIPLFRGGSHTWGNVQCLCHECNSRKQTSVDGQQLKFQFSG